MKERFSTILLGATYYALGYAASHNDCLILEEGQTVGGEFHRCLHPVTTDAKEGKNTPIGQIMGKAGVWTDKGFDLLKAAPAFHEYVSQEITRGLSILLDVRILSVQPGGDGYVVQYFCNEGVCAVAADRVIDTTPDRTSAPDKAECAGKTLNAFTVCSEPDFDGTLCAACPDCRVLDGYEANEKLILFPAKPDEEAVDVYQRLVDTWKRAFPHGEEKILFVAEAFDAEYRPTGTGILWISERFSHPITAFLAGRDAI